MPLHICRGFFFANEFFIFVDLPIDIHTEVVYVTCNGNATSGATRPLRRVNMNSDFFHQSSSDFAGMVRQKSF